MKLVVLVWLGSCTVQPRLRCSGFNMQVNFVVYLCLTGVREVPEPSDTSTAIDSQRPEILEVVQHVNFWPLRDTLSAGTSFGYHPP